MLDGADSETENLGGGGGGGRGRNESTAVAVVVDIDAVVIFVAVAAAVAVADEVAAIVVGVGSVGGACFCAVCGLFGVAVKTCDASWERWYLAPLYCDEEIVEDESTCGGEEAEEGVISTLGCVFRGKVNEPTTERESASCCCSLESDFEGKSLSTSDFLRRAKARLRLTAVEKDFEAREGAGE